MATLATKSVQHPLNTYTWGGRAGTVKAFAFFPDGKRIVTAGHEDASTRVWDLEEDEEDGERLFGWHSEPTLSVAISKRGKEIVTGGSDGRVFVWNAETRILSKTLHAGLPGVQIPCVAFNATSPMLVASGGSDGVVSVFKLGRDEYSQPINQIGIPNKATVSSIAFAPGINYIAVASSDKKVRIYDARSGIGERPLSTFEAHAPYVSSLAWFPAGQQLATAGDKTVRIWDTQIKQQVRPRTLMGHSRLVKTVAVSPDGRFIASGSDDGTLRLWNAVTGVQIGSPIAHPDSASVDIAAFSPDGKVLLSIAKNGGGNLWDVGYLEVEEGLQHTKSVVDNFVVSSAKQQREMQKTFKNELAHMRQTHERELADLRSELGRIREEHEERFRISEAAHHEAMKAQEEKFHALDKALHNAKHAQESQFGRERDAREAQLNTLHSGLQAVVQTYEKGLKGLEDAQKTHEKGLKGIEDAQKTHEKGLKGLEDAQKTLEKVLKGMLEDVQKTHEKGLKGLHSAHKQTEETQEKQINELKKGLQEILGLMKKQLATGNQRTGSN